jgi:uncharacterized protein YbjQ (UPF0145 family)
MPDNEQLPVYTSDTFDLPGLSFQRHIGLCWGLTVVSVGLGKGIIGSLKTLEAGEVPEFTNVVDQARRTALARMIEHAQGLGGNAVVGIRFDSNSFGEGQGVVEVVAYGTAIVASVP